MKKPAIDHITIKGFKSICSIEELPLKPINIIIGPNGSGKSNVIGVFSFLHEFLEGRLDEYVRKSSGAERLLYFGSKTTKEIHIVLSFCEPGRRFGLRLMPTHDDGLYPADELASALAGELTCDITTFLSSGSDLDIEKTIREQLVGWRVYHVHDTSASSPMRKTANLNDNAFLRPDGSNLPAFLYLLQQKHPTSYNLIRSTVQRVAPFFDDFLLEPNRLNPETILLAWKHKQSDQYFSASSLSDGTLRFIALATLFLQPEELSPSVILVDEPELGLHPAAITLLASLVKQASSRAQVIMSTQSSLLLDHFEPEDVLVADRIDGGTQLTRLDSSNLKEWLEDYSLGQLWEKNELGGRPGGG